MHLIFAAFLLIYYLFQARFLYGGDSAEYSLIGRTWGLAHPPGYPLYSFISNVLTHWLTLIPSYARINLLSILPTIATGFLIYLIVRELTKSRLTAVISGSFYLTLFPIWLYGSLPEVFALNNFILALITWLVSRYQKDHSNRSVKDLLFFAGGLAVAHHQTFILLIPGWIMLLNDSPWKFLRKGYLRNLFFLALGLAIYAYAPIISLRGSPFDWENAGTLSGFWRLITRSSYGSFSSYMGSVPSLFSQATGFLTTFIYIVKDFKPFGIIVFLIGIFTLKRQNRSFFKFIFTSLIVYLVFLFITNFPLIDNFATATYERYLIGLYFLMIFPFAAGIASLLKVRFFSPKVSSLVPHLVTGYLVIAVVINFYGSFQKIVQLKNIGDFENYAKDIFMTPEKKSVLAMSTDTGYFASAYYYYINGYRPDIKMVFPNILSRDYHAKRVTKQYPDLVLSSDVRDFISKNSQKNPIYFEKNIDIKKGYWVPYGLLWKYYPDADGINRDLTKIVKINDDFWLKQYRIPAIKPSTNDFYYLRALQDNYLAHWSKYAYFLITKGQKEKAILQLRLILGQYNPDFEEARALIIDTLTKDKKCREASLFLPKTNRELWGSTLIFTQNCPNF